MKEFRVNRIRCALLAFLLAGASTSAQTPLGSQFTYQGTTDSMTA